MGKRPPVRAILEDVSAHGAVARNRQQRRPLIDGDAGVVGLDEPHAAHRAAVELHDVGHAADPVSDQPREDAPFALGPLAEVGVARREEALGVTACARLVRRLRETPRHARRWPSSAGRGRKRVRSALASWLHLRGGPRRRQPLPRSPSRWRAKGAHVAASAIERADRKQTRKPYVRAPRDARPVPSRRRCCRSSARIR